MTIQKLIIQRILSYYVKFNKFVKDLEETADLSKDVIERKERLFQTYLIMFSFFISNNLKSLLQVQMQHLQHLFVSFIISGLLYYSFIDGSENNKRSRLTFNSLAIYIELTFSKAISIFIDVNNEIFELLFFLSVGSLVALTLSV